MAGRAYGKTVWSWPSLLRSSSCGGGSRLNRAGFRKSSRGRGRPERTRLPGEHGISRPTTAQGRPSDWLHLYAAVRFSCVCFSRSGPRVRGQHPAFPAPSWTKRVERQSKARANCAARTGRRVCDRTLAVIARLVRTCALGRAIQYSETAVIESRSCGVLDSPPQCASAHKAGNDSCIWRTKPIPLAPSLRAQRSNPDCHRGKILDCFRLR
jgi:hypothetical protein